MPRGTCDICGATDRCACGCGWADEAQTLCTECVGWMLLPTPNPIPGVFPYSLVPVRDLNPVPYPGPLSAKTKLGFRVDMRRLDRDTIERVAHFAAPNNDGTVEEFLAEVDRSKAGFMVPAFPGARIMIARTLERAADLADGTVQPGRVSATLTVLANVAEAEGGRHRG